MTWIGNLKRWWQREWDGEDECQSYSKETNTHELCLNCEEVGSEKILEVTCGERVRIFFVGMNY